MHVSCVNNVVYQSYQEIQRNVEAVPREEETDGAFATEAAGSWGKRKSAVTLSIGNWLVRSYYCLGRSRTTQGENRRARATNQESRDLEIWKNERSKRHHGPQLRIIQEVQHPRAQVSLYCVCYMSSSCVELRNWRLRLTNARRPSSLHKHGNCRTRRRYLFRFNDYIDWSR